MISDTNNRKNAKKDTFFKKNTHSKRTKSSDHLFLKHSNKTKVFTAYIIRPPLHRNTQMS